MKLKLKKEEKRDAKLFVSIRKSTRKKLDKALKENKAFNLSEVVDAALNLALK